MSFACLELNKYYNDYIASVDSDNVEFKLFTYDEMQEFLMKNYVDYDSGRLVCWENDGVICPYGMQYLEFSIPCRDFSYVVGLVNNSKGGKTIAFCIEYNNNYQCLLDEDKKVVYILFVETNYYFRKRGIFSKALSYIKKVFSDCDLLVISTESDMGLEVGVFDRFVKLFNDTNVSLVKDEFVISLLKRKVL